ncbi:hypothetical protein GCM10011351_30080 [Paraliobacillus quinghaiensis]|uniref:DUF1836 domain-containing protein n=1 Tax=Paraliobacillus quinghaiensis TaxID=470815 RepID=A0A917TWW0_9BACI|nr:DUF1836 domain-containing protein [Paraliobacillus quinghaiensis]GGM41976.1 hypothetical protein GCM10011351_30080 [Paraliobacillus quinghaiensis]
MKNIDEIIEELGLDNKITPQDIPSIDLYMDQVTQLFENTFEKSKRHPDEKVLTKTMINNYAKGKLLFPIKNKKYSKEHIMLIHLIYQLKGALSINDVKTVLSDLNDKVDVEQFNLESIYGHYINLHDTNVEDFKADTKKLSSDVENESVELSTEDQAYVEQVLLIVSLVNRSNMYRKLAERLVDQMAVTLDEN